MVEPRGFALFALLVVKEGDFLFINFHPQEGESKQMFKLSFFEAGRQTQSQPQLHMLRTESDNWISQASVRLKGRLVAPPQFQPDGYPDRVELFFRTGNFTEEQAPPTSPGQTRPASNSEPIVVWCNQRQFFKVANRLQPQTCLEIEGQPLAITGQNGKPVLVVVCTQLKLMRPARSFAQVQVGLCWVGIFGLIVLLELLMPKLVPPGIVPLAIMLGVLRLVEQSGLIPQSLKPTFRGCLVKILVGFAFLAVIWFSIQYSYFTTARFR